MASITISSPPTNLHSPGAIGDVTPAPTLAATQVTTPEINMGSGAVTVFKRLDDYTMMTLSNSAFSLKLACGFEFNGNQDVNMSGATVRLPSGAVIPLGLATASYPGFKRSATEIQCRLADDSGYAPFRALSFTGLGTVSIDSGWTPNTDGGDKTAVIPTNSTFAGFVTALDLVAPGLGSAIQAVASKVKALETVLSSSSLPNL